MIEWMKPQEQSGGRRRRRWASALMTALVIFAGCSVPAKAAPQPVMTVNSMPETLVPIGHTVGIKLFSDGVLVVGLAEVETEKGAAAPAKAAGLQVGDFIVEINGSEVESTEQFQSIVAASGGAAMEMTARRNGKEVAVETAAVECTDGVWRMGAWIRDSLAGIGTMTFYDPENGVFGTLGHGINDTDTGLLMPLEVGSIMPSTVKAVKRGESGSPGELRGDFDLECDLGSLYANTSCGVFGTAEACPVATAGEAVPVARPQEVHTGSASILANVSGDEVKEYEAQIRRICMGSGDTQNFVIEVTDPALLAATGGIVQGMSGSPILQDGKLVGAVTHVMVDDSACGYGIYITNMLSAAYGIVAHSAG